MTSGTLDRLQSATENQPVPESEIEAQKISYTVGVMAYNEEANIKRTLQAILEQNSTQTCLAEVIVVASGCTDNTVPIVEEMMKFDPRIQLIVQERREGKASAINLFLQQANSPVLVMVGADIIPEKDTLEKLCSHFTNPTIGMAGARPIPVNDSDTFVGHAVHLLWRLHDRMARRSPKLGEVVAFRNVVQRIPTNTAVDEISIQAIIASHKLSLVYEPEAIVYNKGPMTVGDFLKQRRRIHAGHLKVRSQNHYEASTMKTGPIVQELLACAPYTMSSPKQFLWTIGTVALEGLARLQGHHDVLSKREHHVWQAVATTKELENEQRKLRRICNTQSVIVFHITREEADKSHPEREELLTMQMIRKLLPTLRRYVRKDDLLSLNGTDMLVAVLNAEQSGAELIAQRLKNVMESRLVSLGKKGYGRLVVRYHAVVFGE